MRKIFGFISLFLFWVTSAFASDLPFTDVSQNDIFYSSVKKLYDGGILSKTPDNLFRPNELMNRDFYVSLTVWVGCKKCTIPDQSDFIRYQISPFTDLPKTNQYYYCIAYAADKNITSGYILDQNGQTRCEDGKSYTVQPFCPANTITRIEAAAILLRRGNLWNDTLNNTNFDRSLSIPDTSSYWYGYAKKAIELGIISQKTDGNIWQDEKITRAEFSMMAAKILDYTQCNLQSNNQNTMEWAIWIRLDKQLIRRTTFNSTEDFTLIPLTSPGTWDYIWKATHPITGRVITYTEKELDGWVFDDGNWFVELSILDPNTKEVKSQPTMTLEIVSGWNDQYSWKIGIYDKNKNEQNGSVFPMNDTITFFPKDSSTTWPACWKFTERESRRTLRFNTREVDGSLLGIWVWDVILCDSQDTDSILDQRTIHIVGSSLLWWQNQNNTNLSVWIEATPLNSLLSEPISFLSIIQGGSPNNTLKWNFWDGNTSTLSNPSHTFNSPWTYTVILTVKDPATWDERQASAIIVVMGESDSDGDGVYDSIDLCKNVRGIPDNNGCPLFATVDYEKNLVSLLSWNGEGWWDQRDTDGDGTFNRFDTCPTVYWPSSNQGCPLWNPWDRDGDGIQDDTDKCVRVPGSISNAGCPEASLIESITANTCVLWKMQAQGMMMANPICSTCPCEQTIRILSDLRSCDIVFPTILSPDLQDVYSRGGFYVVP